MRRFRCNRFLPREGASSAKEVIKVSASDAETVTMAHLVIGSLRARDIDLQDLIEDPVPVHRWEPRGLCTDILNAGRGLK